MTSPPAPARPPSLWRRNRRAAGLALVALAGLVVLVARPPGTTDPQSPPAAFYIAPDPLGGGPPGSIVRSEPVAGAPPGARAWRLLYRSRRRDGTAAALSALVVVPDSAAPANRRNVVAVAHGTVGLQPRCAPSADTPLWPHVDGLARFIRAGDAVVVPDYEGLGTGAGHPYLDGAAQARATLDAVRAARRFAPAGASARFAVWGVGQGGQTALFAGALASSHAPELELAGVAAAAPYGDLAALLDTAAATPEGRIVAAYALAAWSATDPAVRVADVVRDPAAVAELALKCVAVDHAPVPPALVDNAQAVVPPSAGAWRSPPLRRLLAANSAGASAIPVPVVVTQGAGDTLVRPAATERLVARLCAAGTSVGYRLSRGVAHADAGPATAPYVSKWIARRFAGEPAPTSCD